MAVDKGRDGAHAGDAASAGGSTDATADALTAAAGFVEAVAASLLCAQCLRLTSL
jgi:hypothetical protein